MAPEQRPKTKNVPNILEVSGFVDDRFPVVKISAGWTEAHVSTCVGSYIEKLGLKNCKVGRW